MKSGTDVILKTRRLLIFFPCRCSGKRLRGKVHLIIILSVRAKNNMVFPLGDGSRNFAKSLCGLTTHWEAFTMKAEASAETTGKNLGDRGKRKGGRYRYAVESILFQPGGESVSPADWILVAVLAVLLVLALRFRSRGCGGCTGDCSSCAAGRKRPHTGKEKRR